MDLLLRILPRAKYRSLHLTFRRGLCQSDVLQGLRLCFRYTLPLLWHALGQLGVQNFAS